MPASPFAFLFADISHGFDAATSTELLRHLEAMYTLAQVLSLDAEKSARLVEETYLAALDAGEPIDRSWLFAKMRALYAAHHAPPTTDTDAAGDKPRLFAQQPTIKQRLLDPFLRSAAPVAYASLAERDRLLLMLCDAERLSCADAARVLDEDSEVVCRHLDAARASFQVAIASQASPMIRELLDAFDREEWAPPTLRRAIKAEFGNVPPTLEPTIKATLNASPLNQTLTDAPATTGRPASRTGLGGLTYRLKRMALPLTLIVCAGLLGYVGSEWLVRPADPNLVSLAIHHADSAHLDTSTAEPSVAEQFIRERLNWRLSAPVITEAPLLGAGVTELAPDIFVPTLIYADGPDAGRVVVFAFTYAMLDRFADRLFLERSILTAIADDQQVDLYPHSETQKIVIWRQADDIFLAVSTSDPEGLQDRIQRP
ncbi:MAG: hypothetical protein SH809_07705 [Rhodothermales bacterium]|nr:hypothetical protein [Rhodothermales bacterium]